MIAENRLTAKIKRWSVLKAIIDAMKADGKTVVFTNGCFDLLHVGHVRYLQAARALGDCLIVGMNTDDSVRQLKGETRPINPELERAEVLAALECVDYITLFSEETPCKLISTLQPSIHVKGGDYTAEDLPEAEIVKSYGGGIVILPLVHGRSTTRLVSLLSESSNGEA